MRSGWDCSSNDLNEHKTVTESQSLSLAAAAAVFAKQVSTCSGSLKPVQTTVAHKVVPAEEEVEEAAGGMVETGRRGSRHSASFIPS